MSVSRLQEMGRLFIILLPYVELLKTGFYDEICSRNDFSVIFSDLFPFYVIFIIYIRAIMIQNRFILQLSLSTQPTKKM